MFLALLVGCTLYQEQADTLATSGGASARWVRGDSHTHRVYEKAGTGPALRVYIGGDGRAFSNRHSVARDPTPAQHLALRLMLADPGPAVFISRPCYYGTAAEPGCQPPLWTSERYSEDVVDAMAQAIEMTANGWQGLPVQLVGYSGGGVIAVQLAQRLPAVAAVITLATPLDTDAWTRLHGYTPLAPGQNPADLERWRRGVRQVHLSGGADHNVPPALQASYHARIHTLDPTAEFHTLPGYDHTCCWLRNWPEILTDYGL